VKVALKSMVEVPGTARGEGGLKVRIDPSWESRSSTAVLGV
jgi:hypothetical protein